MFSLHETTQRRVCRVAFFAFCIVPTLWTIGWIAHFYRPWRYDDWQRVLSQNFHVHAEVEGIESPRPGVTNLARVTVADLRTQQPLGQIESLTIDYRGDVVALQAELVELPLQQLQAFSKTLETCFATDEIPSMTFRAQRLAVVGRESELFEFANFRLLGKANTEGEKQIAMRADVRQNDSVVTVEILVDRQTENSDPQLLVRFDTNQAQLPAWLVADLVPGMANCTGSNFAGSGILQNSSSGTSGQLQGEFSDIDFAKWLGSFSRHHVEGTGSLKLNHFGWDADGIKLVQGQVQIGQGQVDQLMMGRLVNRMKCLTVPETIKNSKKEVQRFDQFCCQFKFTNLGTTITGTCQTDPEIAGCLMTLAGRPLLLQPKSGSISTSGLAQLLLPWPTSDNGWLPWSRQAIDMMKSLPLPSLPSKVNTATHEETGEEKKLLR